MILSAASKIPFVGWLFDAVNVVVSLVDDAVDSLEIGQIRYDDFIDPNIQRWENVTFHDNYYQEVANQDAQSLGLIKNTLEAINQVINPWASDDPVVSFTPNGRSIPQADIDLRLGFTDDGED